MSREIKFRAKNTINGNWVYGYYFVEEGIHKIHSGHTIYPVHQKTVGEFSGVMHRDIEKYSKAEFDQNGNCFEHPVYEDDIVEFKVDPSFYLNVEKGKRYVIQHLNAGFFMRPLEWGIEKVNIQNTMYFLNPYDTSNMRFHYEVIGNIHDNPELL